MVYRDTILKQLIALVPRYEFDALAEKSRLDHGLPRSG